MLRNQIHHRNRGKQFSTSNHEKPNYFNQYPFLLQCFRLCANWLRARTLRFGLRKIAMDGHSVCRTWSNCNRACAPIKDPVKATACQIRCGDLYKPTNSSSSKIDAFSECVISEHHCVKQTKTNCPKPAYTGLVSEFNVKTDLVGLWYITRGLNNLLLFYRLSSTQLFIQSKHKAIRKPLHGDLKYNVKVNLNCTEDCKYLPREVFQSFSQDSQIPGHLMNHNNSLAEMHYSDDWYVLYASEKNILIYYCGCNDAMCGYGGSVCLLPHPEA